MPAERPSSAEPDSKVGMVSANNSPAPTPPPHSSPLGLPQTTEADQYGANNCLYSKEHPRARFSNRGEHPYWGLATANHWTPIV